jgi:hypothetical protein
MHAIKNTTRSAAQRSGTVPSLHTQDNCMLYKFKSKAAGDLIMLQPQGQQMLGILGKEVASGKGILQAAEMSGALAALQAAVAREEEERQAAVQAAEAKGETVPRFEGVSLRQRAAPLIEMIRRCELAGQDIVWGV